jgi:hypothetical protein
LTRVHGRVRLRGGEELAWRILEGNCKKEGDPRLLMAALVAMVATMLAASAAFAAAPHFISASATGSDASRAPSFCRDVRFI